MVFISHPEFSTDESAGEKQRASRHHRSLDSVISNGPGLGLGLEMPSLDGWMELTSYMALAWTSSIKIRAVFG